MQIVLLACRLVPLFRNFQNFWRTSKTKPSQEAHQSGTYSCSCSMKLLGVFRLPLPPLPHCMDGCWSIAWLLPPALYWLVPIDTRGGRHYEIKCLSRFGVERSNHHAPSVNVKCPRCQNTGIQLTYLEYNGISVLVHPFYRGKVTLARLLQTPVNTDRVKEASLIQVTLSYKVNCVSFGYTGWPASSRIRRSRGTAGTGEISSLTLPKRWINELKAQ